MQAEVHRHSVEVRPRSFPDFGGEGQDHGPCQGLKPQTCFRPNGLTTLSSLRRPAAPVEQALHLHAKCCVCSMVVCSASAKCCVISQQPKTPDHTLLHCSACNRRLDSSPLIIESTPCTQLQPRKLFGRSVHVAALDIHSRTHPCHRGRRPSAALHAGRTGRSPSPAAAFSADLRRLVVACTFVTAQPVLLLHAAKQQHWPSVPEN